MTNQRFDKMFDRLAGDPQGAIIPSLTLGFPDPQGSLDLVEQAVEAGADALELVIPFTDPVAVSPPVAETIKQALEAGVRPSTCLELVDAIRQEYPDLPLMTFGNIPVSQGVENFFGRLAEAGADTVRIPELSSLEAESYAEAAEAAGLSLVLHATPNASDEALERIAGLTGPYTFVAGLPGQSGDEIVAGRAGVETVERLRESDAPAPVVGFGIAAPEHVRAALEAGAAGVVCNAALAGALLEAEGNPEAVGELVGGLTA